MSTQASSTESSSDRQSVIRSLEEQLRTQAFYDPLTELPNRSLLLEYLRAAEDALETHGTPLALLYLDMDNLKAGNDNVGHEGGDRLLQVVSTRILDCLRPADVFARLAGAMAIRSSSACSEVWRGAQPSTSRARVVSMTGTPRPRSTQPAGVGCGVASSSITRKAGRSGKLRCSSAIDTL